MEKIFNVLLVFGVLIALYFCIQKHKQENNNKEIYYKTPSEVIEKFNMDKIKYDPPIECAKIKFDYETMRLGVDGKTIWQFNVDIAKNVCSWLPW